MVWRKEDPQGNEAAKVRYELVPYLGASCLDLGCGPTKVYPHFIGVDSCKDTALFGIPMKPDLAGDVERLEIFADSSFETVFSSHTLEHLQDYRGALREWWRLVKPGGFLILYLPHRDHYPRIGDPNGNPDHKHDFDPLDIVLAMTELAPDWSLLENQTRTQLREYSFFQVYRKEAAGFGHRHPWREPRAPKRAAIVRLGAYGDALWASSLFPWFKEQGYELTVYSERAGCEVLAADPHVDRLIEIPHQLFDDNDLLLYLLWESGKYERFINLTGAVETRLLPHPNEPAYYWTHEARHREMNRNYLEAFHSVAGVPEVFAQRFYPTAAEHEWALAEKAKLGGPMVVLAPSGSGLPKTWPHSQRFMELLAAAGVHTIVLGELRQQLKAPERFGHVIGKNLPIRHAMALARVADAVVGEETSITNAVAFEPNVVKAVLLSHSSAENLTKHWLNTIALEVDGLACHPCHRLHHAFEFCVQDPATKFAACQAALAAETVAAAVLDALGLARPPELELQPILELGRQPAEV
jgi:ADP-heptose:LPS heptosyltransferase